MFIKLGTVHVNPANITHFILEGAVLTVYFVGGTSIVLDKGDAKQFVAELERAGRY